MESPCQLEDLVKKKKEGKKLREEEKETGLKKLRLFFFF